MVVIAIVLGVFLTTYYLAVMIALLNNDFKSKGIRYKEFRATETTNPITVSEAT